MTTWVQVHDGGWVTATPDYREGYADGYDDAQHSYSYGLNARTLEGRYGDGYDEGYHKGLV
jgi:hypothetical protein